MINSMIFSKDRACQLDLLLRSIKDHFSDLVPSRILWRASSREFEQAYKKLGGIHPEFHFEKEVDFVKQTRETVMGFKESHCLFLVDDEIVIRPVDIWDAQSLLTDNPNIHCVSLRLNTECTYCYPADCWDELKSTERVGDFYVWDWTKQNPEHDFGYPSCINSHLYRTKEFQGHFAKLNFFNVNNLEGMFNNRREKFQPKMACFQQSKTINIANNLTQSGTNRAGKKIQFSLAELNRAFLDGKRISARQFYGIENTVATFEEDYQLEPS